MKATCWTGTRHVEVEEVPDPKILGEDPAANVQEDLRRLKMLIETGEIATIDGQPSGRK